MQNLQLYLIAYSVRDLFRSVRPGVLTVSGSLTTAYLHYYQHHPNAPGRKAHNIYGYGVDIWLGRNPLEIFADYVFCLAGNRWIPERSPVYILHVTSEVYFVLKDKEFFELDATARLKVSSPFGESIFEPALRPNFEEGAKFVRIGIMRSAVQFRENNLTQRVYGVEIE